MAALKEYTDGDGEAPAVLGFALVAPLSVELRRLVAPPPPPEPSDRRDMPLALFLMCAAPCMCCARACWGGCRPPRDEGDVTAIKGTGRRSSSDLRLPGTARCSGAPLWASPLSPARSCWSPARSSPEPAAASPTEAVSMSQCACHSRILLTTSSRAFPPPLPQTRGKGVFNEWPESLRVTTACVVQL